MAGFWDRMAGRRGGGGDCGDAAPLGVLTLNLADPLLVELLLVWDFMQPESRATFVRDQEAIEGTPPDERLPLLARLLTLWDRTPDTTHVAMVAAASTFYLSDRQRGQASGTAHPRGADGPPVDVVVRLEGRRWFARGRHAEQIGAWLCGRTLQRGVGGEPYIDFPASRWPGTRRRMVKAGFRVIELLPNS